MSHLLESNRLPRTHQNVPDMEAMRLGMSKMKTASISMSSDPMAPEQVPIFLSRYGFTVAGYTWEAQQTSGTTSLL